MKNNFIKILFVIFTVIGIWGFFNQAKAVVDPLVVEFETTPLFSEANFLPGEEITRWVKVTNNSGSSQRIAAEAINKNDPNEFSEKLNLTIKENETVIFNDALKKFFDQGEIYLSNLANDANAKYNFTVSFNSDADDFYQGKTLGFDMAVGFEGTEGGWPFTSPGEGSRGGSVILPQGLTIAEEAVASANVQQTSVTIFWTTSYQSTSQVIYAKKDSLEKHSLNLSDNAGVAPYPPKYGYERTTLEYNLSPKVTFHEVTLDGLESGTEYYFRPVSHGSLAIGREQSFTTFRPRGEVAGVKIEREKKISGLAQDRGIISEVATGEESNGKALSLKPEVFSQQLNKAGPMAAIATGKKSGGKALSLKPEVFSQQLNKAGPNVATLSTSNVWLAIIIIIIVIALIVYFLALKKKKNKPL